MIIWRHSLTCECTGKQQNYSQREQILWFIGFGKDRQKCLFSQLRGSEDYPSGFLHLLWRDLYLNGFVSTQLITHLNIFVPLYNFIVASAFYRFSSNYLPNVIKMVTQHITIQRRWEILTEYVESAHTDVCHNWNVGFIPAGNEIAVEVHHN